MLKFLNFSLKAALVICATTLVLAFSAFYYFSSGLPDYKKLANYQPPISSRVYSNDGKLIAEYALEKRLFIPFDAIPSKVVNSFLSAEDKNFFNHPGIDAKGILRATIKNFSNILNDKRLEGASTITQQVAKNFLLTNEVSLRRKIKEAILAFRIEKAYTKKRILELYLNQIYLGQGTYGIAAASLEYFDKSVKDLNYSEAAMLAALPKAPSRYNPINNLKEATFRRNLVLKNLMENNFISKKEYNDLIKTNLKIKKRKITISHEANSYTEEVRRIIKDKYGFKKLYTQGLSIKSPLDIDYQIHAISALRSGIEAFDRRRGWRGSVTNKILDNDWENKISEINLDPTLKWNKAEITNIKNDYFDLQILDGDKVKIYKKDIRWALKKKEIEDVFKKGDFIFIKKEKNIWTLKQYPKVNGAIVVLDPFTGEVKALVGGFSYMSSEFNRATQAKRQPGSAFKPFVYAAALENGLSPTSIILDAPFIAEQGIGLKDWKPENYGKKFYGPSTLRKGIEYSRNLMTVRIAKNLGLDKILDYSEKLEIYEDIPELLSVSLGSAETTLLNLTSAYATFVNGGNKIYPTMINRIQDRRGKTIYSPSFAKCNGCDRFSENIPTKNFPKVNYNYEQIMSEQTAYQITSILEGVVKRGTGKKLRELNVPLAGKTGTTNNNFDAWFIGYNSNLVIGVYVGYDNPKTLGKFETGSKAALPIFKEFVKKALYKEDFKEFPIPNGIYFAPVNYNSGEQTDFDDKNLIIEAFKEKDINNINNKKLILNYDYDKLIKFRQFY
jgi:penicillin-binding protein 1A|tara:strand:+ start:1459 stop:3810 length:2352 start_codon:yes stop_codon:yes gene_type:complete